jgi:hypothetical protein
MTYEQRGIYITLLCIQHQHGGVIGKDYFNAIVNGFPMIREKFIETDEGFYNDRLNKEVVRRTNFTESRKRNLHMDKHMGSHMGSHMETETENIKEQLITSPICKTDKVRHITIKPNIEDISNYIKEIKSSVDPEAFFNFYEANGWMQGRGKPIKNWKAAVKTWERRQPHKQDVHVKEARQTFPSASETDEYLRKLCQKDT